MVSRTKLRTSTKAMIREPAPMTAVVDLLGRLAVTSTRVVEAAEDSGNA